MPYTNALYCASIPSLVYRREQLSRKFFYINLTIYLNGSQLHNDKAQAAQLIAVYM